MAGFRISVDLSGMDRVQRMAPQQAERWLAGYAEDLVTATKQSFGTSPPGRSHSVGQGRTHVASRPGYPPNVDTGQLRSSVRQERTGHLQRTVLVGAEYAERLEFGGGRTAARPFLRPQFDDFGKRMESDARRNLNIR